MEPKEALMATPEAIEPLTDAELEEQLETAEIGVADVLEATDRAEQAYYAATAGTNTVPRRIVAASTTTTR